MSSNVVPRVAVAAARIISVATAMLAVHGCDTEFGVCDGELRSCESRLSAEDCSAGDGCTWQTPCAPIDCISVSLAECQTYPHCHTYAGHCDADQISDAGLPSCTASVTTKCLPTCAAVSRSDCTSVPGCAWRTACTGHPYGKCSDLQDEDTCRGAGCSWTMRSTTSVG